jgi:diguanylate cyclase (GGDEF)-like protein
VRPLSTPGKPQAAADLALDLSWEGPVQRQLVRDLYERSRLAVVTMLVLAGVVRWAIDPAYRIDGGVRAVFWLLITLTVTRLVLALIPRERRDQGVSIRGQFVVFAAGATLSALLLGALVVLSWPLLDPARIAILAVITSGLVSGAVMSLGFSPLVYMLYMLPPVSALFYMAVTDARPDWGANILATAFAIYALAVLAISLDQRRTRLRAIQLELQLSDLVVRDTLTRLHNRRFLQEFMTVEAARIARDVTDLEQGRQPSRDVVMGLYMLDLDYFKSVNDTHGHAAGDALLQHTAAVLTRALRKSDNLVRWGGEEFVAVAWVKDASHVPLVAEKLRTAVEQAEFALPDGQILRKTVSIGFGSMPFSSRQPRLLGWEQVLSIADAALYFAKAEGRNRWIGVTAGDTRWTDADRQLAEVVANLQKASARGLVQLLRLRPAEPGMVEAGPPAGAESLPGGSC